MGSISGPVVACAALAVRGIRGIRDSKLIAESERNRLSAEIKAKGWWHTAIQYPEYIAQHGIKGAWKAVVWEAAVRAHQIHPDAVVLVDGPPDDELVQRGLPWLSFEPQGDDNNYQIGAASIVAKVYRDAIMIAADEQYPGYGFARNRGYGTPEHLQGIRRLGLCPIHRVKEAEKALRTYTPPELVLSWQEVKAMLAEAVALNPYHDDWGKKFVADIQKKVDENRTTSPRQNYYLRATVKSARKRERQLARVDLLRKG
jgi:ribonuclease HII